MTLKLTVNRSGEVVAIREDRAPMFLGPQEEVCGALADFLAQQDFGEAMVKVPRLNMAPKREG